MQLDSSVGSVSSFVISIAAGGVLAGVQIVVTISAKQKSELGRPYLYKPLVDPIVYQGLYENGFVLWVDGRFFELGLDRQYWASFVDHFRRTKRGGLHDLL